MPGLRQRRVVLVCDVGPEGEIGAVALWCLGPLVLTERVVPWPWPLEVVLVSLTAASMASRDAENERLWLEHARADLPELEG